MISENPNAGREHLKSEFDWQADKGGKAKKRKAQSEGKGKVKGAISDDDAGASGFQLKRQPQVDVGNTAILTDVLQALQKRSLVHAESMEAPYLGCRETSSSSPPPLISRTPDGPRGRGVVDVSALVQWRLRWRYGLRRICRGQIQKTWAGRDMVFT